MSKLTPEQVAQLTPNGQLLHEIGIELILATEKAMLVTDLTLYSNSPAMKGSLITALAELKAAEKLLPKVADPALYKTVDESLSLPKNRVGGVPRAFEICSKSMPIRPTSAICC